MAGERKGITYEAIVKVALDELVRKGKISGQVFWNIKPEGIAIEPDFTVGHDKDHPSHVFLVTHSAAAKNSNMKFWRNIGELAEAKIRLPEPARVYSVVFDSDIMEDLKVLQAAAFDGQLLVGDEDYGRQLQRWVDTNGPHLPKDRTEKVDAIGEAMKGKGRIESPRLLIKELARGLVTLAQESRPELDQLWAMERKRPVGRAPAARETFVRRGTSKLLIFEDVETAVDLHRRRRLTEDRVPAYAFALGLARRSIAGAVPADAEILNAFQVLNDAQIRRLAQDAPISGMAGWLSMLRRSEHLELIGQYVTDHLSDLRQAKWLAATLNKLHADPAALIRPRLGVKDWPPTTVWLLDYLVQLVRLSTGSANGFGYAQLGREVVEAGFTRRAKGNPRIWVGGFILSDWVHRRGAEKLDRTALLGIATVLSKRLRSIGEMRLVQLIPEMPAATVKHVVEAKLVAYKMYEPLFTLIRDAVPNSRKTKFKNCFAEATHTGAQAGFTTVAIAKHTIINWQSAHGSHTKDKTKELCGRAIGLRYSWDSVQGQFVERAGVKKLALVLDGTWEDADLSALVGAGWDEIFYPRRDGQARQGDRVAMLAVDDLVRALSTFRPPPDAQQQQAVNAPASAGLFIVAGPGTGKTASLTLRILKLVLVDGLPPRGILATTFTNKAAEELRSRILGWGFRIIDFLQDDPTLSSSQRAFVDAVDINQVRTGTVDSLCEQLLREFRAPGTQPPVLVDEFVSKTLMLREGLFGSRRDQNPALDALLLGLHSDNGNRYNFHAGTKANLVKEIWERRFQDQVNWPAFPTGGPPAGHAARKLVDDAQVAYETQLRSAGLVDFSLLEDEVLRRLRAGQLKEFTDELTVVLVDEYQDTNLMQEQLYFELAGACAGALVVVGDDDQSLYRFRGATVDLFRDFPTRYQQRFGKTPTTVFLTNNYRSTRSIVSLVNGYATLDAPYQAVRVAGKPVLAHGPVAPVGLPVLGMFRNTLADLASDLAQLIHAVFRGGGYAVTGGTIVSAPDNGSDRGDVGDCALLCSSPAEFSASNSPRLPLLLRQDLAALTPPIAVFNPRGEDVATIDVVERFGGLLLECLDPGGVVSGQTSGISRDAQTVFARWRQQAINFAGGPSAPAGLLTFAQGWANRDPGRLGYEWPKSTTAIELIYGLVHYLPELHDDPEGQVYLEVFTRQLSACQQLGKFDGRVITDRANQGLSDASVKELVRDFLAPIANGLVDVNEELMETFPRDRLSVLSIHQSKGLEFPFTIVDVGSDFKDLRAPSFKRFPTAGSTAHRMENLLRPHSPLGVPPRSQVDRAFDDLYRQFFVAFSRPQDVLLLVGVTPTAPGGRVPNAATGWDRGGTCRWTPTLPFVMI